MRTVGSERRLALRWVPLARSTIGPSLLRCHAADDLRTSSLDTTASPRDDRVFIPRDEIWSIYPILRRTAQRSTSNRATAARSDLSAVLRKRWRMCVLTVASETAPAA